MSSQARSPQAAQAAPSMNPVTPLVSHSQLLRPRQTPLSPILSVAAASGESVSANDIISTPDSASLLSSSPFAAAHMTAANSGPAFQGPIYSMRSFSSSSLISLYARRPSTAVSLNQLFEIGQNATAACILENAQFLHKELPVRLARRARELENLPYGLSDTKPVQTVASWYVDSFKDIVQKREPSTEAEELEFSDILEKILYRHRNVVPMMAQGILQLKESLGEHAVDSCPFLQDFLDRFYMSRIGIRVLIQHHVELHHPRDGYVGLIASELSPSEVAESAIGDAAEKCERQYGCSPDVDLKGNLDLVFRYVPHHLHHMLHELLKNSMRAVVETHGTEDDLPDVQVVIADGNTEVVVRISDQGGGMSRENLDNVWTYLYTTAAQPPKLDNTQMHGLTDAPMAGLGFGLPLSRLFARYFGGDLRVVSMEGYGTDAYLHLNKLGDGQEFLPY
jgi:pyruvate dehydrogenase kinase 2/3/4